MLTSWQQIKQVRGRRYHACLLEFNKGFNGNIEVTTAAKPKDFHASISVSGEKGTIVIIMQQ